MPIKDRERRNAYMREYYAKNPKKHGVLVRKRNDRYIEEVRYLLETAKSVPCLDCGGTFHTVAMDFDHVRGKKLFNIGEWQRISPAIHKIKAEMAKCEIICSNCHRVRTWNRLQEAIHEGRKPDPDDLTLW